MSALSELFHYLIIISLAILGVFFFIKFLKRKNKSKFLFLFLITFSIIILINDRKTKNWNKWEMENAGKYKLINYNNKRDCILILEETKTFKVIQNDSVLETGNWHFEVGGDYFIVYLNDKKDQLESGRFEYSVKVK